MKIYCKYMVEKIYIANELKIFDSLKIYNNYIYYIFMIKVNFVTSVIYHMFVIQTLLSKNYHMGTVV